MCGTGNRDSSWRALKRASRVLLVCGKGGCATLCAYTRVDRPTPKPPPPSPITADVYRRLTLDANPPPRSPFAPFDYESPKETPGVGTLLGIDAEFVSLAPAVKEPGPEGEEIVVQPVRLGLARVSVVRGDPDHPRRLVPVMGLLLERPLLRDLVPERARRAPDLPRRSQATAARDTTPPSRS